MTKTRADTINLVFVFVFQRSWIALLEKGVDFEYIEQDPYDKTPEFLAINPRGLVPALVHENQVVIESGIINGKL